MARPHPDHIVVIGAGAAGLMAARELARAGKRVTILEARDRCGGRIHPLPSADFGYPAEGGAEFVHGEAPVTHGLLREAGLSLLPIHGTQWTVEDGKFSREESEDPHEAELHKALQKLKDDLTVAEFLRRHFAGPEYDRLRHSIERMVEGYDAADPERASTLALREEWMDGGRNTQARIIGGYGALVAFLTAGCRNHGVAIHLGSAASAIEATDGKVMIRCTNSDVFDCDTVILTLPLPLLKEIALPAVEREKAAAATQIGFGNVIKILLRFETRWWIDKQRDFVDLTFLLSDARIPVWWTQHPAEHPVLTGWFGGPKTEVMARLNDGELIEAGSCFARRHFRSISGANDARSGRGAGDQLGKRSFRARSLFVRDARNARRAVGTRQLRRRGRSFFRRGTLPRARHGHCRGSAGQRTGGRADYSGR
jgi:monoamine oxidase